MARGLRALMWIGFPAIAATILFVSAGRVDLPMVWAVLAVLFLSLVLFTPQPSTLA